MVPGYVDVLAELDPHMVAQQLQRDHVHDTLQRPVRDGNSHCHELGTVDIVVICGEQISNQGYQINPYFKIFNWTSQ